MRIMAKKNNDVSFEVVALTPKLASSLLETNVAHQRHLSRSRVEGYSDEIKAGRFPLTGQGILVNKENEMIDGQHRCAAVLMAKKAIPQIVITRGIDKVSFAYIDTGKQRAASDVLAINGYKSVTSLAALLRVVLSYDIMGELHIRHTLAIPNANVLDLLEGNPARYTNLNRHYAQRTQYIRPLGLGSTLPGLHMILSNKRISAAVIEEFMDLMIYGEKLQKTHPVYQLRHSLIEASASVSYRMQLRTKDARLIKTWNAFIRGEAGPGVTQWNALKDEYPKIVTKAN